MKENLRIKEMKIKLDTAKQHFWGGEMQRLAYKKRYANNNGYYSIREFKIDYSILHGLLTNINKPRDYPEITVYFKIKFFRHLAKIPFMDPNPYMIMEDGCTKALKDSFDLVNAYLLDYNDYINRKEMLTKNLKKE